MRGTILRLRQCQRQDYAAGCELGAEDGAAWAKDQARLADVRQICNGEVKNGQDLFQMLNDADAWDADRFREQAAGHDEEAFLAGYFLGFVKSVKTVWAKVHRAF